MVNERKANPVERMAELLAEMTERATVAEQQLETAKEDTAHWYQRYRITAEKLESAEEKLTAKIQENEALRSELAEYIENLVKCAQS